MTDLLGRNGVYELVSIKQENTDKNTVFVTLEKGQFKVKVKQPRNIHV
jgi:hypothetical protein